MTGSRGKTKQSLVHCVIAIGRKRWYCVVKGGDKIELCLAIEKNIEKNKI